MPEAFVIVGARLTAHFFSPRPAVDHVVACLTCRNAAEHSFVCQHGVAEGKKYIGQKSVSTNANGNTGTFSFSPTQVVPEGHTITATATDPDGNASEFSTAKPVT